MSATTATVAAPKKSVLRVPQVRILKALARNPRGLSRSEIADKAKVSPSMTANLGPVTGKPDETDEHYGKRCLLGLKMVKAEYGNDETTIAYTITDKGRKALESLKV